MFTHGGFKILLDGTSPTEAGIISIVKNKDCESWQNGDEQGFISGWFVEYDGDEKPGLRCVYLI